MYEVNNSYLCFYSIKATFISMKNSLQFVYFILLLPITKSAGSSCAFTGACLYNINVHHCDGQMKRSLTQSGHQLCPCSDVTTLKNQQQNLSSWIGTINTTFHQVRAELVGLKEELKEKSTELAAISGRNKQDNATLQKYNKETLTTEIAISNERQIWFTERDRLQNELHRVITESQVCQQVTTTSSSSHQGTTSDASIVLFCDFETSGQCGFQQDHSDDLDWSYGHGTQSSSTGPKEDHTYGNPHGQMPSLSRRQFYINFNH